MVQRLVSLASYPSAFLSGFSVRCRPHQERLDLVEGGGGTLALGECRRAFGSELSDHIRRQTGLSVMSFTSRKEKLQRGSLTRSNTRASQSGADDCRRHSRISILRSTHAF